MAEDNNEESSLGCLNQDVVAKLGMGPTKIRRTKMTLYGVNFRPTTKIKVLSHKLNQRTILNILSVLYLPRFTFLLENFSSGCVVVAAVELMN